MTIMHISLKKRIMPKAKAKKQSVIRQAAEGFLSYNETAIVLRRILANIREELELIRRMKAETAGYRQKTATKAHGETHRLTLHDQLTKHREIEEIIRQASEEIQQMLADIRIIRITAQEELAALRKCTDADNLNSIFTSIKEALQKPAEKATAKKLEAA